LNRKSITVDENPRDSQYDDRGFKTLKIRNENKKNDETKEGGCCA